MEPSTAVLPRSKPLTSKQSSLIFTVLYGIALAILLSIAFPLYVFIALGGFDSSNSGSSFMAFIKTLLLIGVYIGSIVGCAYGFLRHAWRLFKGGRSYEKQREENVGLMQYDANARMDNLPSD